MFKYAEFEKHYAFSLRLRDIVPSAGAPMLSLGDQLGRRGLEWSNNLYLQILTGIGLYV